MFYRNIKIEIKTLFRLMASNSLFADTFKCFTSGNCLQCIGFIFTLPLLYYKASILTNAPARFLAAGVSPYYNSMPLKFVCQTCCLTVRVPPLSIFAAKLFTTQVRTQIFGVLAAKGRLLKAHQHT